LVGGVEVQDAWHIFRWVWAAVLFAYLAVQVAAFWRLDSGGKKRARTIMFVMLALMVARNSVRDVFENREVSRVGSLVVVLGAVIATVILLRMLRTQPMVQGRTGIEKRC
jgi:tryptophan-rich sensory protein